MNLIPTAGKTTTFSCKPSSVFAAKNLISVDPTTKEILNNKEILGRWREYFKERPKPVTVILSAICVVHSDEEKCVSSCLMFWSTERLRNRGDHRHTQVGREETMYYSGISILRHYLKYLC